MGLSNRTKLHDDDQMIEIKEGPELDRAVAEIVGDPYPKAHDWECMESGYEMSFFCCKRCGDLEVNDCEPDYNPVEDPCLIPYSTDLNAAFAAAEKVGLWERYGYCRASGQYVLSKTVPINSWGDTIAHEPTPALAICAAILKLRTSIQILLNTRT